jgi:tellurite methyltransferase
MKDWQTYYNQHLSRPPRPLLVKAISLCVNKTSALDIGAGTLIESKFILDSGFKKVVAMDSAAEIKTFAEQINNPRLEVVISSYQDFIFVPESYDLINAQYALPFHGHKDFKIFTERIISSLKPGGVFTGQFFGIRDGWNATGKDLAFQTMDEAKDLLKDLKIKEFTEEEKDGTVASGKAKHWHVFHFIAVK